MILACSFVYVARFIKLHNNSPLKIDKYNCRNTENYRQNILPLDGGLFIYEK